MSHGRDNYRFGPPPGRGGRMQTRPGYDRAYGPSEGGRFRGGRAWGGFRHMNEEELRAGAPKRIERAAREGYTGYGGYPGPRRSEQWGRYDVGYRRAYGRGW